MRQKSDLNLHYSLFSAALIKNGNWDIVKLKWVSEPILCVFDKSSKFNPAVLKHALSSKTSLSFFLFLTDTTLYKLLSM